MKKRRPFLEECKAEIVLLREKGGELMRSKDLLEKGEREQKQRKYNSKCSVLRSFKWEEETIEALVLGLCTRLCFRIMY